MDLLPHHGYLKPFEILAADCFLSFSMGFWGGGRQDVGRERLISSGLHPTLLWPQ
jgi:hypothetical protein